MVAAQWDGTRDDDARTGGGVSGRFRLLGASGDVPDPTPPPFGTAPWGYRRSEVDAWASWVAGLIAHGRNETVRADSAEATLKATLERLDRLECPVDAPTDLPRRAPRAAATGPKRAERAPGPAPASDDAPPTGPAGVDGAATPSRDHDMARLQVVETTLREVMDLLHRLADRDGSPAER